MYIIAKQILFALSETFEKYNENGFEWSNFKSKDTLLLWNKEIELIHRAINSVEKLLK